MSDIIKELRSSAKAAAEKAYAPYSGFHIGASVLTDTGRIFNGQNIENSSYGATVCAERVAIFKAISEGERTISKVYVYSKDGWPPCGLCRQVMAEFADQDMEIIMGDERGTEKKIPFKDLFPLAFTPDKLNK